MKILVLNQDWFVQELRAAGHEVITCGPAAHLQVIQKTAFPTLDAIVASLPGPFRPDLIIYHDNSSPVGILGFEQTDIPVLFYSVDAHHHHSLHRYLAHLFDYTLIAQKDYVCHFEALGRKAEWMPLWASKVVEPEKEKKYGAVFVGTLDQNLNPERVKFFAELQKKVQMLCTMGGWTEIFPKSEIVINQTVKGDLNFRVFEGMVSGALMLTERSPNGLFELFKDGEQIVAYSKNNVDEAAELINTYLADKKRCREIATAGREEILTHHLPMHRAQRVLEIISTLQKTTSPMRQFAAFRNFAQSAFYLERQNQLGASARALFHALQCFEKGLSNGDEMTQDVACHLVVATALHDRHLAAREGRDLLLKAAKAYPSSELLTIARIRALLNEGQIEEATGLAKDISNLEPKEVFSRAEEIMQSLMGQVMPR